MGRDYQVSVTMLQHAFKVAKDAGLAVPDLLAGVPLPVELLTNGDAWVSSALYQKLMAEVTRQAGNEYFWLRGIELDYIHQDNIGWFYAMNAPTVRESGHRATRAYRLFSEGAYPEYLEDGADFLLRLAFRSPTYRTTVHLTDWGLSQFYGLTRHFIGATPQLKAVHLVGPQHDRVAPYEAFFGVPTHVNQPHNQLVFERSVLDLPNHQAPRDRNLDNMLNRFLENALVALPQPNSIREEIFKALQNQLIHGKPALAPIARQMGLSPRSLQRRIAETGHTFRDLVQEVRQALAAIYLTHQGLNVTETALLLGYTETASLTTAFRRWYGMSPLEYQRQHAGSVPRRAPP